MGVYRVGKESKWKFADVNIELDCAFTDDRLGLVFGHFVMAITSAEAGTVYALHR
jgi:hypothetical protein